MFRVVNKLADHAALSARRDSAARQPRRTRVGLESLEDRRVPVALLASAVVKVHFPPGPCIPALAAHFPGGPI
jgi:hypothetical protein